jgi:hypothetical protein
MKKRKSELDVDFLGGGRSLTKEEEKIISDYIKATKAKNEKKRVAATKVTSKTPLN